jgi:Leucine-rich repeat (LRR) protein
MARALKVLSIVLILGILLSFNVGSGKAVAFTDCVTDEGAGVSVAECQALVDLYNSTGGPTNTWTDDELWLVSTNVDDWFGIVVDGGHVTQLDISNNNLVGSIPSEIQDLDWVTSLNLASNNLSGSIPASMGGMNSLAILYLYGNSLTGSIPPELGNLVTLTELNVSENDLSGTIPPQLGNLTVLNTMQISRNSLSGSIPVEVASLPALQYFYVTGNELTGSIPGELFTPIMRYAWLNENNFSGTIPSTFSSAVELRNVLLNDNYLTGLLPASIGNLTKLNTLWINYNDLYGPIPASFSNLVNLNSLIIGNNGFWSTDPTLTAFIESKVLSWEEQQASQGVYPLQDQKVGWGDLANATGFSGRVKFSKYFNNSGTTASKYKVGVYNQAGNIIYDIEEVETASVCPTTGSSEASICTYNLVFSRFPSLLTPGVYQWRVMALDGSTWKDQDTSQSFTIAEPPVVNYPTNQTTKVNPTFKWAPVEGAERYNLVVLDSISHPVLDSTFYPDYCTLSMCTYPTTTTLLSLANDSYTWMVRADMGGEDYTDWGSATFTKVAAPTTKWPSVTTTMPNPKIIWTPVAGQTRYQIQLYTSGGVKKLDKSFDTSVCGATTCTYAPTTAILNLANGAYKWKVRAGDAVEWGTYSAFKTFNKVSPPAGVSPTGTITATNPTFKWKKIAGATKYYLELRKSSGVLVKAVTISSPACTTYTCTYTFAPALNLAKGDYKWHVKAYHGYFGPYGEYMAFKKQ